MSYAFRIVNVFAEIAARRQSARACSRTARGLDDATMQALALQFNLSETTFVLPSTRRDRARAHLHADVRDAVRRPSDARHARTSCATLARRRRSRDARDEGRASSRSTADGDVWTLQANAPKHRAPDGVAARELAAMLGLAAPTSPSPPLWVDTGLRAARDPARDRSTPFGARRRRRTRSRRTAATASARWRTCSRAKATACSRASSSPSTAR